MAIVIYILGSLTTLLCAGLLLRRYLAVKVKLLLWSGLCFAGLTINNVLVFVDRIIIPDTDFYLLRLCIAAASTSLLLFGLIWDSE